MLRTSSITVPSVAGLRLRELLGGTKKFDVFCLSVTRLNGKVCANDLAIKALEHGNAFDIVGERKMICSCAPASRILFCLYAAR